MAKRKRRVAGMRCPRCEQFCYRMSDGTLSEHRTDMYAIGSQRKERCPYSGGTDADARAGITPVRRRRLDREKRHTPEGG